MRLPRKANDPIFAQILTLAKEGASKKSIADAVSLPTAQFRRYMASLVDMGLLHYDPKTSVWITTDRGIRLLKA